MSSDTMTDALFKCYQEAQPYCVKWQSGSLTVSNYVDCIAGKLKLDVKLVLKIIKAILKHKTETG